MREDEKPVWDMFVPVPWDVEGRHGVGKSTHEFLNVADEVCVSLSLFQLAVWAVPVRDDTLIVGPSPQGGCIVYAV